MPLHQRSPESAYKGLTEHIAVLSSVSLLISCRWDDAVSAAAIGKEGTVSKFDDRMKTADADRSGQDRWRAPAHGNDGFGVQIPFFRQERR
jgi:hypothetical protein